VTRGLISETDYWICSHPCPSGHRDWNLETGTATTFWRMWHCGDLRHCWDGAMRNYMIRDRFIFTARRTALARHLLWRRGCVLMLTLMYCAHANDWVDHDATFTRLWPSRSSFPHVKYETDSLKESPSSRASNGRGLGKSRKILSIWRRAVCQRFLCEDGWAKQVSDPSSVVKNLVFLFVRCHHL